MQGNRIEVKLINLAIALSQRYKQSLKKKKKKIFELYRNGEKLIFEDST